MPILEISAADMIEKLCSLYLPDVQVKEDILTKAIAVFMEEFNRLKSQILELDSWLHDPGIDDLGCGDWLTKSGYSYQEVSMLLKRAKQYNRGRPPKKRQTAIAACEARHIYGHSWSQLAKQFCDCGHSLHGEACRQRLRMAVTDVEAVRKKFREIPVPFASLSKVLPILLF